MIHKVFDLAVADDVLDKNPCGKIESASWQKKAIDLFTLAEAEKIIASMIERYPQQVANYTEFMFFSGLRTSEGLGFEWSCINLNSKMLRIDQAFAIDDIKKQRRRAAPAKSG